MVSSLLLLATKPSKKGATLKGKNLLPEEQILSFKCRPPLVRKKRKSFFGTASSESVPIHIYSLLAYSEEPDSVQMSRAQLFKTNDIVS